MTASHTTDPTDDTTPERLPTLCVEPHELAPTAIVVGDPGRARAAADLLDSPAEIGRNREYVTYAGSAGGTPVVVSSHGVGAGGANICFEELIRGGVRTLIRAGTCGGIVEDLEDGAIVVASSAVREDGASDHLLPPAYPAVASGRVTRALLDGAREAGTSVREGMIVTEANFYPGPDGARWRRYAGFGPLAVEMEMSSLYVLASLRGAEAGGIVTVDGNLVARNDPDMSDYDPHRTVVADGVARMLEIAVTAAASLGRETGGRS